MSIAIDQMRLHLPSQFRDRAGDIARLIGEELGALRFAGNMSFETLELPVVRVGADAGSREVARAIAKALADRIGGQS